MNKFERRLKGLSKFKKRIKAHGFTPAVIQAVINRTGQCNLNVYKTTGNPCSCPMCSPGKVEEKAKYKYNKFDKKDIDTEE
jgi:hypothetical protein